MSAFEIFFVATHLIAIYSCIGLMIYMIYRVWKDNN